MAPIIHKPNGPFEAISQRFTIEPPEAAGASAKVAYYSLIQMSASIIGLDEATRVLLAQPASRSVFSAQLHVGARNSPNGKVICNRFLAANSSLFTCSDHKR